MAKIDKIKEKIALYKFVVGVLVAFILSVGGWIINNYESDKTILLISAFIAIVSASAGTAILFTHINKLIDELEDL